MLHLILMAAMLGQVPGGSDFGIFENYVGGTGAASGLLSQQVCTQAANDVTPDVGTSGSLLLGCNIIITADNNTGATAITTFDGIPPTFPGVPGSILYVVGPATAANPTTISDGGSFTLERAWSAPLAGSETRVLVLECIAADTFVEVGRHNGPRHFDDIITQVASLIAASGNEVAFDLSYTVNKAGGDDTGMKIYQTDTASPGTSRMLDLGVGANSQWSVTNEGLMTLYGSSWTDTMQWYHDETDAYYRTDDGNFIFQTDEATNSPTTMQLKPKGSSEVSSIGLYDTNTQELYAYTAANRGYIQSNTGALGLQNAVVQDVNLWETIASGNPSINIYGWNTAGSDRESTELTMDDTNDEFLIKTANSANHEGVTVELAEGNQKFRLRQASDVFDVQMDGTDAQIKWSDGALNFMTDEGTNVKTTVTLKPKGTSEISELGLYDTDGQRLFAYTAADRAYIESQGGALGLQNTQVQNVLLWEGIASGNPSLTLYGWNTAGSDRESTSLIMDDANDEFLIQTPNSGNHEGVTVSLQEGDQKFRLRQASDVFDVRLDGDDTYIKTSDGSFILQTDEATNTVTDLSLIGKGTAGATFRMTDGDDDSVALFDMNTTDDVLAIGNDASGAGGDITLWSAITSGNPYFYIYGWDTTAVQYLRMSVDATGDGLIETDGGDLIVDTSSGETRFSDENIKDVADIQLDSITADATSGGVTMGGTGAGDTESLLWRYGETADIVDVTSASGVTLVDFNTLNLATDELDLSDGPITNVSDIALDSITPDGTDISVTIGAGTVGIGDGTYSWNHTPNVGIEGILEVDSAVHAESTLNAGGTFTAEADLASTSAADWDLLDNTDDTLCFESPGDAGTLCIDSRDGADGVHMAGYLTVDGVLTAGGGMALGGNLDYAGYDRLDMDDAYATNLAADTLPRSSLIIAQHPWAQSTTPANYVGANMLLAGSTGRKSMAFVAAGSGGNTITITHNDSQVEGASTSTVYTADAGGWTCSTVTNAECACNLYTIITGAPVSGWTVQRTDGTCSDAQLFFQPDATTWLLGLAETGATFTKTEQADGYLMSPGFRMLANGPFDLNSSRIYGDEIGDPNTYMTFTADDVQLTVGGVTIRFSEAAADYADFKSFRIYNSLGAFNLGAVYGGAGTGATGSTVFGEDGANVSAAFEGTVLFEDLMTGVAGLSLTTAGSFSMASDINWVPGSTGATSLNIGVRTEQTPATLMIGTNTDAETVIIAQKADITTNFARAQRPDPTLCLQSADATQVDDVICLSHNQTDAQIAWINGNFVMGYDNDDDGVIEQGIEIDLTTTDDVLNLGTEAGATVGLRNTAGWWDLQADGDLILDNPGATVNSPTIYLRGDDGGVEEEASLHLVQGADPYLRISVDDDNTTPGHIDVLDIHDTIIANSTAGLTSFGDTANHANYFSEFYAQELVLTDSTAISNHLTVTWDDNDTVDRTLGILMNSGNRTLTMEASAVISQDYSTDSATVQFDDLTLTDDLLLADDAVIGIAGNEIITFDDAGTVTVSGATLDVASAKGARTATTLKVESVTFPGGGGAANAATVGSIIPDGAIFDGISTYVTTADNGGACTGYTVGDGVDIDLYGVAATETQGTTTTPASATASISNPQFGGPYEVTITGTGGNCIDMVVRITAHYRLITADTTL